MSAIGLRAGIVGCGAISKEHVAAIAAYDGATLVACADVRPDRAQAMADRTGARAYGALSDMLAREKLDVLHICTPHYLHALMIERGLDAGLYVFCEKPPVISRTELERLLARPDIGRVGVCFQNRWNPATVRVRELIRSGELGAPLGIRSFVTWKRGAGYYLESGWRGQWASEGGGVLINQSIHTLDLMIQFMGAPVDVRAVMANHHLAGVIEVEDTLAARMQFGEAAGVMYATTGYAVDAPVLIEIECADGAVRIEGSEVGIRRDGKWAFEQMEKAKDGEKAYWGNGHIRCIAEYYRCVRERDAFTASLEAVTPTIECMLSMYEQNAHLRT